MQLRFFAGCQPARGENWSLLSEQPPLKYGGYVLLGRLDTRSAYRFCPCSKLSKTQLMGFHDSSALDFHEWAASYAALIEMHTSKMWMRYSKRCCDHIKLVSRVRRQRLPTSFLADPQSYVLGFHRLPTSITFSRHDASTQKAQD